MWSKEDKTGQLNFTFFISWNTRYLKSSGEPAALGLIYEERWKWSGTENGWSNRKSRDEGLTAQGQPYHWTVRKLPWVVNFECYCCIFTPMEEVLVVFSVSGTKTTWPPWFGVSFAILPWVPKYIRMALGLHSISSGPWWAICPFPSQPLGWRWKGWRQRGMGYLREGKGRGSETAYQQFLPSLLACSLLQEKVIPHLALCYMAAHAPFFLLLMFR